MEASTANHSCPLWQDLYEAAILELDRCKIPERIALAQHAILARIEDLKSHPDYQNEPLMRHLVEALRLLRNLDKIVGIEENS